MKADLRTWLRAEWDRVAGFGLLGVGAVILIFGYIGVSNATDTPEALCYVVSGGIGSILVFGAGATLLISADLHDEWRKLNRIEAALDRLAGDPGVTLDLGDGAGRIDDGGRLDDGGSDEPAAGRKATPAFRSLSRSANAGDQRLAMVDGRSATFAAPLRVGATGIAAAGGVLALAWWRTASELTSKAAFGGVAVGLAAVLLASLAGAGGIASTRRRVERRKASLLQPLDQFAGADARRAEVGAGGAEAWAAPSGAGTADGWVVVAEGLTEYHRPGCPALPNHDLRTVRPEDVPAGLRPCRLCET